MWETGLTPREEGIAFLIFWMTIWISVVAVVVVHNSIALWRSRQPKAKRRRRIINAAKSIDKW